MSIKSYFRSGMMSLANYLALKITLYYNKPIEKSRQGFFDFNSMCDELRPGDVILIEGRNRGSIVIKRVTFSPWTHAALYIGKMHDIKSDALRHRLQQICPELAGLPLIIESYIGQGTLIKPTSVHQNEHARICRPIGLGHMDAEKVIDYAQQQVGKKYSFRGFFDLGRFLLKSKLFPRLWKSSLFKAQSKSDSSQDICSTMLADAFKSIDFPILPLIQKNKEKATLTLIPRNPRLFTPCDFDYSPYFNIIKYPIFKLAIGDDPKDLPWDKTRQSNDDLGISRAEDSNEHPQ